MDICACCQERYEFDKASNEWSCVFCDTECVKKHTMPISGCYRFLRQNVHDDKQMKATTYNLCPCCKKEFVIQNDQNEWYCFYCDDANATSWKCLKLHDTDTKSTGVFSSRRLAEKRSTKN